MTDPHDRNPLIYLSGGLAAAWVVVAWLQPDSNFYLFPVLIAGFLPLSYRIHGSRRLSMGAALGAGVAGLINVVVVATLLTLFGKLDGPRLVGFGGPLLEATVLGVIGAGLGAAGAMASLGRRRR